MSDSDSGGEVGDAGDFEGQEFNENAHEESVQKDQCSTGQDDDEHELEGGIWPNEETANLIELFRLKPNLYDTTHKWYSNRDKKIGTYTLMAAELKVTG